MAAGDGLVIMRPTSIVVSGSGSSASINSNGGVDFSSATSLSLNNIFTSEYENYLMLITNKNTVGQANVQARLRASGTDESGSNYSRQYMFVTSTSISSARSTETSLYIGCGDDANWSGDYIHIYSPFLAVPTTTRNVSVNGELGAYITENCCTHSLSTSYDGMTLILATGTSGTVNVFGYEE